MSIPTGHEMVVPGPGTLDAWIARAYDEHGAAIHAMALRSTRDPEAAADVTQEAFLRLFMEARHGRFPDNVRAWLYRASTNLVISRARRAAVARRYVPMLLGRDEPVRPDEAFIERERNLALSAALGTLSAAERAALIMAAQGVPGVEIAAALGRSHAATRTLMSRARLRLRAGLARELDESPPAPAPSPRALPEALPV
jgi:RNA polymerase sigma-70 factor (ECF subfamily)